MGGIKGKRTMGMERVNGSLRLLHAHTYIRLYTVCVYMYMFLDGARVCMRLLNSYYGNIWVLVFN